MNKSPEKILEELNKKFNSNFSECIGDNQEKLSQLFLNARAVSETGQILRSMSPLKYQEKCCLIFDEIFSDIVLSIYLASCAIDQPANIVLRRVLELGVAVIYLWDMPHIYYLWEQNDHDLSFTEMITHVNSEGYRSYVESENAEGFEGELIESDIAKKLYGELSDIAHGKISSFESGLENSFSFRCDDWRAFVVKAEQLSSLLLDGYLKRFNIKSVLYKRLPALGAG